MNHVPVNWRRMIQFSLSVCAVSTALVTASAPSLADNAAKLNNRGIKAYDEHNIDESVRQFTEALVERPDTPELLFNRGTALSAAGQTGDAVIELQRAASASMKPKLGAAAHFNAGNAFMSGGDTEQAVEEYKRAVMLDQSSEEYRKNLELVLRQQQQQEQQQQQNSEGGDQENNENQDENSDSQDTQDQDPSGENDESQDQQQQNQQNQQQQDEQSGRQDQPDPSEATDERPMSPEEAERILDAIENEEEQALELRRMQMQETMRPGDDW